jgi:MtN3 and saliva related transmembrane protein
MDMAVEAIGWFCALVLFATIGNQVLEQWRTGNTAGVSPWLFAGQTAASFGFAVYSALTGNGVFLAVNVALLCSGMVGQLIYWRNRRRRASSAR